MLAIEAINPSQTLKQVYLQAETGHIMSIMERIRVH